MNSRERQLAAIRHEIPDRIPVDAICVENVDRIAEHLKIGPHQVPERLGLDGRLVAAGYTADLRPGPTGEPLTPWGTVSTGDYGTVHWYPLSEATTVADIEKYPWPDPARYDYDGARRTAEALGMEFAVRGPYWWPLFCRVCELFGLEVALVKMATEAPVFEAALEGIFQHVASYRGPRPR